MIILLKAFIMSILLLPLFSFALFSLHAVAESMLAIRNNSPMKVVWVYKFFPAIIISNLPSINNKNKNLEIYGVTTGIVVKSVFSLEEEKIVAHELEHVKQYYRTIGLSPWIRLITRYNLLFEYEAFKAEQMNEEIILATLQEVYSNNMSIEQIRQIVY